MFQKHEILSFDAQDNRIMCFPHNTAVQHVLKAMSLVDTPETDNNSEDLIDKSNTEEGCEFGQTFKDACAQYPIAHVSGQLHDAFINWIEIRNKSRLFVLNDKLFQI